MSKDNNIYKYVQKGFHRALSIKSLKKTKKRTKRKETGFFTYKNNSKQSSPNRRLSIALAQTGNAASYLIRKQEAHTTLEILVHVY